MMEVRGLKQGFIAKCPIIGQFGEVSWSAGRGRLVER